MNIIANFGGGSVPLQTILYGIVLCGEGQRGNYADAESESLHACGATGRYFVREGERVIRITSKELKRKLQNSKSNKRAAN